MLADWQLGMWLDNRRTVRRAVERLVRERPVAVLIAGDIIYGPSADITGDAGAAAALARPLVEAGIPTYAVLGSHDYGLDEADGEVDQYRASAVRDALESDDLHAATQRHGQRMNAGQVATMASEPQPGDFVLFYRARGRKQLLTERLLPSIHDHIARARHQQLALTAGLNVARATKERTRSWSRRSATVL